jgi:hypothetical protein
MDHGRAALGKANEVQEKKNMQPLPEFLPAFNSITTHPSCKNSP